MAIFTYRDPSDRSEQSFRPTRKVLGLPEPAAWYEDAGLERALWRRPGGVAGAEARWSPFLTLPKRQAKDLLRRGKLQAAAPIYRDGTDRERAFLDGEVLAELKEEVSFRDFSHILSHLGSRVVRCHWDAGVFTLASRRGENPFAAMRRFEETGAFARLAPSEVDRSLAGAAEGSRKRCRFLRAALRRPPRIFLGGAAGPDPLLLALHDDGDDARLDVLSLPFLAMAVDRVWSQVWGRNGLGTPGDGSVIALVDRPVFRRHPDLLHILPFDRATENLPTRAQIREAQANHGTRMAGVATARRNSRGALGAAPGADLLPVARNRLRIRIEDRVDLLAAALRYLNRREQRRVVLNFSWGISAPSPYLERRLHDARELGFLLVAAAGNGGDDLSDKPVYPACSRNVTCVAARRLRIDNSNGAPELVSGRRLRNSNHGAHVDFSAPGECYYTTHRADEYALTRWTSAASAAVSGIAALLWSAYPRATRAQILAALRSTARGGRSRALGAGWVHAADAARHLEREVQLVARVAPRPEQSR